MKYFDDRTGSTAIGLAYSPGVVAYVHDHPDLVDYIEVPFEQLRHTPEVAKLQEHIPLVLHCASMSVAGDARPTEKTLEHIQYYAEKLRTPWIGEHLAYMSANPVHIHDRAALTGDPDASDEEPVSLHYTVCPQLSQTTLDRTVSNVKALSKRFDTPILFENSPQYFAVPGSTMPINDFIASFFDRVDNGMLLDLTHFIVSAHNNGYDASEEIEKMPLERVVEMHISGYSIQSGVAWDDHAISATEQVFSLLSQVLKRANPRAITFEYNWDSEFPPTLISRHIKRVRAMLESSPSLVGVS